jgi:protoporphyrinogen oxidase
MAGIAEEKCRLLSTGERAACTGWDAVVLGAGIGGLVATKILLDEGFRRILIIEEYEHVGGNHISCDRGPYTFDIGAIIFQDDSPLIAHFPELLQLYHPVDCTASRVAPDNRIYGYPFSFRDEILRAGPVEWLRTFGSILRWRLWPVPIRNARDYARYWMGARLLKRSGLDNYLERFNGVPPVKLDRVFAEKRMGWIANAASVRKQIARLLGRREPWEYGHSFVRPREGFGALYALARASLQGQGVIFSLGERLQSVMKEGREFRIRTLASDVIAKRLISTIPLAAMLKLCGIDGCGSLPTIGLISLFFSFRGARGFRTSVLYNFSATGRWKRLTMFSDFYDLAEDREYFGVEVNDWDTKQTPNSDPVRDAREDFIADSKRKGLFDGDLRFEGVHCLPNAYPAYWEGATGAAKRALAALQEMGVESIGRQGAFDYLPTARQVTQAVEARLVSTKVVGAARRA